MSAKSVDWVKIAGLAVAILLLIGSQWYYANQNSQRRMQYEREMEIWTAQQKEKEEEEAARRKAEAEARAKAAKTEEGKSAEAKSGEPAPGDPVKTGEAKSGETKSGEAKSGEHDPPVMEAPKEIAEAPPVEMKGEKLTLTFSPVGASLRKASLATIYPVSPKYDPSQTVGLEILDEIEPGRLSLALTGIRIGDTTYGDLEARVWEEAENTEGFAGEEKRWTLAYATTVTAKTDPYAPVCRITKRFTFAQGDPYVGVQVIVKNLTKEKFAFEYGLRGAAGVLIDGPASDPKQGAYVIEKAQLASARLNDAEPTVTYVDVATAGKPDETKRSSSLDQNLWGNVHNRFFVASLVARDPTTAIKISAEMIHKGLRKDKLSDPRYQEDSLTVVMHRRRSSDVAAGASSESDAYAFYLGPSQEDNLTAFEESLQLPKPVQLHLTVQYCDVFGWRWPRVDLLGRLLLWIFKGIYALTSNYGVAVILLTLIVKLALHPLQRKQSISMFKMQELQPQLKAIEDKYAGATSPELKQKKEMEKWDLMRKAGANPLTGCLPMFLQMPILFALYGAFSHAFEIRQASFLWAHDLSLSDRLADLPFWPHHFNLLPILYMGMTITQTLMQPKPATMDPAQESQRKMMSFMPVMFGFLFYNMPSGLLLYFASSATFGMLESWYIKKFVLKKTDGSDSAPPATSSSPIPGIKAAAK
ncbi:MAG: YidC/Oxa1 family insertase periplasmic-domain containing protein [Planctomycetota bacterium]|nr:YidC/Oxa1 family insertase periplasmic-domain containing protein [Planctomycetota bacterium]